MKMTDLFLAQLDSEAARTKRALERVPEGRDDWKPHDKSMPLGRLAMLIARMPSWVPLIVTKDSLDLNPAGGSNIEMDREQWQIAPYTEADLQKQADQLDDCEGGSVDRRIRKNAVSSGKEHDGREARHRGGLEVVSTGHPADRIGRQRGERLKTLANVEPD